MLKARKWGGGVSCERKRMIDYKEDMKNRVKEVDRQWNDKEEVRLG